MAQFIMAMNINQNAKRQFPNISHHVNESLSCFKNNNIKIINLFATLGRFDYIAFFEAGDQTLAFKVAAEINGLGILDTETWPVVPFEDFAQLLK